MTSPRDTVQRKTLAEAPSALNTNDKAMWLLGWNEAAEALAASPIAAQPDPVACPRGHLWNDYGQLGGRNVSWCCRCDAVAWTGKEPEASPTPAPEPRQWQGLTPVEVVSLAEKEGWAAWWWTDVEAFAAALSDKLREKNAAPAQPDHAALPCGHPASLLLRSAETGQPLYCELCDDKSGRRDAEQREQELRAENAALVADAMRYRWLRSTTNFVTSKGQRIDVRNQPEVWDAAIDAALKGGAA